MDHHAARPAGRVQVLPGAAAQRRRVGRGRRHELDEYLHLYLVNRGILLTAFHNMALMSPASTAADADAHASVFAAAADELLA